MTEKPPLTPQQEAWLCMSDLFLDTWFDEEQLDMMAQTLSELPFTSQELESMFEKQVAPACGINLLSAAGEWSGFDRNWLFQKIENLDFLDKLSAASKSMTQWNEVFTRIKTLRQEKSK